MIGRKLILSIKKALYNSGIIIQRRQPWMGNNKWLMNYDIKTVLDVGANVGKFAVHFAEIFPEATIHSFEPIQSVFSQLEQNTKGYNVKNYDPIYSPNNSFLDSHYDLITMTEVLEHLHKPFQEFNSLVSILRMDGLLGIMTAMHSGIEKFPSWHYKNDPTHVCFFSRQTMQWLARESDLKILQQKERTTIFIKN